MENLERTHLSASHAMWVGDYENAVKLFSEYLQNGKPRNLALYRIYFDLAIANAFLKREQVRDSYMSKLEGIYADAKENERRSESNFRKLEPLFRKGFDIKSTEEAMEKYFSRDEDIFGLLISHRFARRCLQTAMKNAKASKAPEIFTEGIFRYTLRSELYRLVARAYSSQELQLESLRQSALAKILVKDTNVYYVESDELNVIAAIQREGIVLCQYLLQSPRDTKGAKEIRIFLEDLSKIFSAGTVADKNQ